jgi:hypothetical protein
MNWYNAVVPYIGKWAVDSDLTVDYIESIVKNICDSNGVSYYNTLNSDKAFIIYESVAQIFMILSTKYADSYPLPLAIGITADRSKITKNLLEIASTWQKRADEERKNLSTSITITRLERLSDFSDEEFRLSTPIITIQSLLNNKIRIIWDLEESTYFVKYELYLDSELIYTSENRYLNYYDIDETTGTIELRKYSSDEVYSFAELTL